MAVCTPGAATALDADANVMAQTAQHALVAVDTAYAAGFFEIAAKADVDSALDRVVKGLRVVEGREPAEVGWVYVGYVSADLPALLKVR